MQSLTDFVVVIVSIAVGLGVGLNIPELAWGGGLFYLFVAFCQMLYGASRKRLDEYYDDGEDLVEQMTDGEKSVMEHGDPDESGAEEPSRRIEAEEATKRLEMALKHAEANGDQEATERLRVMINSVSNRAHAFGSDREPLFERPDGQVSSPLAVKGQGAVKHFYPKGGAVQALEREVAAVVEACQAGGPAITFHAKDVESQFSALDLQLQELASSFTKTVDALRERLGRLGYVLVKLQETRAETLRPVLRAATLTNFRELLVPEARTALDKRVQGVVVSFSECARCGWLEVTGNVNSGPREHEVCGGAITVQHRPFVQVGCTVRFPHVWAVTGAATVVIGKAAQRLAAVVNKCAADGLVGDACMAPPILVQLPSSPDEARYQLFFVVASGKKLDGMGDGDLLCALDAAVGGYWFSRLGETGRWCEELASFTEHDGACVGGKPESGQSCGCVAHYPGCAGLVGGDCHCAHMAGQAEEVK